MKGQIQPDHIPLNKAQLIVLGLPDLTLTSISGIEEELEVIDLPDRTKASGGRTMAVEFDVTLPLHHTVQFAAMMAWYQEGQDPVLPTYKKPATLLMPSISGNTTRSFTLVNAFIGKFALPDTEMSNEGEMAEATFTIHADDILPL
jgi:hypothetical protein